MFYCSRIMAHQDAGLIGSVAEYAKRSRHCVDSGIIIWFIAEAGGTGGK